MLLNSFSSYPFPNTAKRGIITLFVLAMMLQLSAQNARFSQISTVPMMLNPSLSGRFNGDIKVGSLFSWQHTQRADMAHQDLYIDFKAVNSKKNNIEYHINDPGTSNDSKSKSYLSLGFNYYSYGTDPFGVYDNNSPLRAHFYGGNIAYHFFLTADRKNYAGVGAQFTYAKAKLDETWGQRYDKEISGGGFKYEGVASGSPLRKAEYDYFDMQAGFYYGYKNDAYRFELGGSIYHFIHPRNQIPNLDQETKLRMRGTLHSIFAFKVSDRWSLVQKNVFWSEGLYLRSRAVSDSQNIVTLYAGLELHDLKPKKKFYMNYGLYTRSFKTLMPYLSMNLRPGLNVRMSYEWALNGGLFPAYTADRAEIGISYSFVKKRNRSKSTSLVQYDLW